MAGRIVVFGATGFTGRLTSEALVRLGHKPLLAGRDEEKLRALAERLGGLSTQVASVEEPRSVRALVSAGDVLVSTVGPFSLYGKPALDAALDARAHYLDSTGEPSFVREVFTARAEGAERAQILMLTAFGYDYVPGQLAAGLALRSAGEAATRVDVGYFVIGKAKLDAFSQGTLYSMRQTAMHPGMEFQGGRLVSSYGGQRVCEFDLNTSRQAGISIGSSEHYTLPRSFASLHEVNVYLGWYGKRSYAMSRAARVLSALCRVPFASAILPAIAARVGPGSQGQGPDAATRAQMKSQVAAVAYDADGGVLARADLIGDNPYDFTAAILAWGAARVLAGQQLARGACGPIEAFGLDALVEGCAGAGFSVRRASSE